MNRKILVSLGIIGALILYIGLSKVNCSRDGIKLKGWEGSLTEITLKKGDRVITLAKKDGKWLIGTEQYPANSGMLDTMETKLKEITGELISEQPFYAKYDLTPDRSVDVVAKQKGTTVRKLVIGKKGSTMRHTYCRLDDRPGIYLVTGTFDTFFDKTVDELRDKEIFKVTPEATGAFTINYQGRAFAFNKTVTEQPAPAGKDGKPADKNAPKPEKTETWACKGFESIGLDKDRVVSFLGAFNPMRATKFLDVKKETLGAPLSTVKLTAYGKEVLLTVFGKKEGSDYTATSSESPYVFTLSEWQAKRFFLVNLDEFKKR